MQKLPILAFVLLITTASIFFVQQNSQLNQFKAWQMNYGKKYDSVQDQFYRSRIFYENIGKIQSHNSKHQKSYELGVNQFTDLTQKQFEAMYFNFLHFPLNMGQYVEDIKTKMQDVDWTAQGAVTPVKNEGSQCGACWAFSAIGPIESLSKIKDGVLRTFSEQHLIDCSQKYGNYGCNGGWMTNSYKFVMDNGICEEKQYPYIGKQQTCQKQTGSFKISGYSEAKSCDQLQKLITKGPVSVAVSATTWYMYKSGIFDDCKSSTLNFAAVLVGSSSTYWKVKNAWGESWGQNGYIRLAPGDTCGICQMASIPYK